MKVNQEQFLLVYGDISIVAIEPRAILLIHGDIRKDAIEREKLIILCKKILRYCILMQLNQAAALLGTPSTENCLDVAGGLFTKSSPK